MSNSLLNALNLVASISFEPVAVQLLGNQPKLDNKIVGQVLRLSLAPLFSPEAMKGALIGPHYDLGV